MSRGTRLRSLPAVTDPDAALVRGLKCEAPESYRELLDRYQGPVFAYVWRLVDDPSEAEDVTQDIFVKVFRKIGDFREDCTLKTWIYRIAAHESSNRRRWFSRHRLREVAASVRDGQAIAYVDQLAHPGRGPFEHTEAREHRDILSAALREIDPRFREAVVLRDISGFSYNEIAETLGISLGTVKSRIMRGREALKRQLLRHAPALVPGNNGWQTE